MEAHHVFSEWKLPVATVHRQAVVDFFHQLLLKKQAGIVLSLHHASCDSTELPSKRISES